MKEAIREVVRVSEKREWKWKHQSGVGSTDFESLGNWLPASSKAKQECTDTLYTAHTHTHTQTCVHTHTNTGTCTFRYKHRHAYTKLSPPEQFLGRSLIGISIATRVIPMSDKYTFLDCTRRMYDVRQEQAARCTYATIWCRTSTVSLVNWVSKTGQ